MDTASFIGYPAKGKSKWWDKHWKFPIARTVNISSLPSVQFNHDDVKTSDTLLVSGLSFSGSSGSIVISHEKGIKVNAPLEYNGYVPPRVIGIMSGHWPEPNQTPSMFNHSGLSYFTRSTSILDIIRAPGWNTT